MPRKARAPVRRPLTYCMHRIYYGIYNIYPNIYTISFILQSTYCICMGCIISYMLHIGCHGMGVQACGADPLRRSSDPCRSAAGYGRPAGGGPRLPRPAQGGAGERRQRRPSRTRSAGREGAYVIGGALLGQAAQPLQLLVELPARGVLEDEVHAALRARRSRGRAASQPAL